MAQRRGASSSQSGHSTSVPPRSKITARGASGMAPGYHGVRTVTRWNRRGRREVEKVGYELGIWCPRDIGINRCSDTLRVKRTKLTRLGSLCGSIRTLMNEHHGHEHAGESVRARNRRALVAALVITALFCGAEVVGGLLTGSLALLADAGHMVT